MGLNSKIVPNSTINVNNYVIMSCGIVILGTNDVTRKLLKKKNYNYVINIKQHTTKKKMKGLIMNQLVNAPGALYKVYE